MAPVLLAAKDIYAGKTLVERNNAGQTTILLLISSRVGPS
jgi:hypothetical protein